LLIFPFAASSFARHGERAIEGARKARGIVGTSGETVAPGVTARPMTDHEERAATQNRQESRTKPMALAMSSSESSPR
jgi:hypothetical protein